MTSSSLIKVRTPENNGNALLVTVKDTRLTFNQDTIGLIYPQASTSLYRPLVRRGGDWGYLA